MITKITEAREYFRKNHKVPQGWCYDKGMEQTYQTEMQANLVIRNLKRKGFKAFWVKTWKGSIGPRHKIYKVIRTRRRL